MQLDDARFTPVFARSTSAAVLAEMHPDQAGLVRPLLSYEDDTAGGIMTPRLPVLRGWMTVSAIHSITCAPFTPIAPALLPVCG